VRSFDAAAAVVPADLQLTPTHSTQKCVRAGLSGLIVEVGKQLERTIL